MTTGLPSVKSIWHNFSEWFHGPSTGRYLGVKMSNRPHPLQGALEIRGWTAAELSRRSGVTEAGISRIIARQRRPTADTVAKLARALNLELADLLEPWVAEDS